MTLSPTHSLRWLKRGDELTLQQLFYDERGGKHWIDVPIVKEKP